MLPALQTPFLAYGQDATKVPEATASPADVEEDLFKPIDHPKPERFAFFSADIERDRHAKKMMQIAILLKNRGEVAESFPIMEMMHIHTHLQNYAYQNNIGTENATIEFESGDSSILLPHDFVGFVSHMIVMGHGNHANGGLEPYFGFGATATATSHLRDIANARLSLARYMAPGSTIHLQGCETGRGIEGKEYAFHLGRIMFGHYKRGKMILNQLEMTAITPEMQGGDPRTFHWPEDFMDEMWGSPLDLVEMFVPDALTYWSQWF